MGLGWPQQQTSHALITTAKRRRRQQLLASYRGSALFEASKDLIIFRHFLRISLQLHKSLLDFRSPLQSLMDRFLNDSHTSRPRLLSFAVAIKTCELCSCGQANSQLRLACGAKPYSMFALWIDTLQAICNQDLSDVQPVFEKMLKLCIPARSLPFAHAVAEQTRLSSSAARAAP